MPYTYYIAIALAAFAWLGSLWVRKRCARIMAVRRDIKGRLFASPFDTN
jgi:hypothetical protein